MDSIKKMKIYLKKNKLKYFRYFFFVLKISYIQIIYINDDITFVFKLVFIFN